MLSQLSKKNDLNPNDSVRLDDDGEKAVKALKIIF